MLLTRRHLLRSILCDTPTLLLPFAVACGQPNPTQVASGGAAPPAATVLPATAVPDGTPGTPAVPPIFL